MADISDRIAVELAEGTDLERAETAPSIPVPVATVESLLNSVRAIKQVLDMREGRSGSVLEKAATFRDLYREGAITVTVNGISAGSGSGTTTIIEGGVPPGYYEDPRPVLTVPPTPTDLTASGTFKGVFLEWNLFEYRNHLHTEIWRATTNSLGSASLVGQARSSNMFFDDLGSSTGTFYYWVRAVNNEGTPGAYNAGSGAGVAAGRGIVGGIDLGPLIVEAANLASGAVTAAKIAAAAVDLTKFAAGIEPVTIVVGSTIPTTLSTRQIFLTGTSKMYRWDGTAYVATVPSTDITGTLADAQIAAVAASKITGQLTDSQLAAISAAKLTGQITSTQITDGAISTPKLAAGSVTTAALAADSVTAAQIAAGAVTATEIAAGAVTTAKIAAGAVTAGEIAAGAVTAGKIAANAVTAAEIAADAVTAGKIAAGAVSAAQIAAGAVQADKLLVTGRGAALNDDPNTQDASAWAAVSGSFTIAAVTDGLVGASALNIPAASSIRSRNFPVNPEKRYRARFSARAVANATTAGRQILCLLEFFNAAGAQVGGSQTVALSTSLGAAWTSFVSTTEYAPPSGAVTARFLIGTTIANYQVQDIRLEEFIGADLIVNGAIVAGKIAANAIAVGSAAIANGAISNAMIANLAVDSAKIVDGSILTAKIGDGQITTAKIGDAQITNAKIVNLDASKITTGFLDAARIAAGSITAGMINGNGLVIRDNSGNPILGVGTGLPIAYAPAGTLNSNITINSSGQLTGAGTSGVTVNNALVPASGGNVLRNPLFLNGSTDGWGVGNNVLSTVLSGNYTSIEGYRLNGNQGAYLLNNTGVYSGDTAYSDLTINTDSERPLVVPGKHYQFSIGVNCHRAGVEVYGYWLDSSGAFISSAGYIGYPGGAYSSLPANGAHPSTYASGSGVFAVGGSSESNYLRIYMNGTAPVGAVKLVPVLRMFQAPGQSLNYVFMARAMCCEIASVSAPLAPFDVGGGVFSGAQQISSSNVSTYIASAAIGWAQIGDLQISTGGGIRSGKTAYGSGTGWLIEYNGGTPRLDIGSSLQYLRWTGSALEVKLNAVTLTATTPSGGAFAVGSTIRTLGTSTVTASGGTPPYTYNWSWSSYGDPIGASGVAGFAEFSSNVATFKAAGAVNSQVYVYATCTVTDSNGLTATITRAATGTFGTPP